ncbi:unnamed protein product, partial [marine sediment metagenome]
NSTMVAILPGTDSIAYGVGAGISNIAGGNFNTFIGNYAGQSNTTGDDNTANGYNALFTNTNGGYNTANGYAALYSNTGGNYNTANGYQALYYNTGNSNTANGSKALYSNTIGHDNTANGYKALFSNIDGRSIELSCKKGSGKPGPFLLLLGVRVTLMELSSGFGWLRQSPAF